MSLNPKQQRFVDEMIIDGNATRAYTVAYGTNGKAAESGASRLLRNAKVAAAIDAAKGAQSKRTGLTADRVLEELAAIAFSSHEHYSVQLLGGLQLAADAPKNAMRAVSSVKVRQFMHPSRGLVSETEYKLWDKNTALTNLGRHFKLFTDKLELSGTTGLGDRLKRARERAKQHG